MIMKNFKFLYLLLAAVGVVAFTSCTEEWTPGPQDTNVGVYFPEVKNKYNVTVEDSSLTLAVSRVNTEEAASVTLRAEALNQEGEVVDFFSFPRTLEFAAGVADAELTFQFDGSQLVMGEEYTVVLQLDAEQASTYGTSECSFVVMIPEPWAAMGTGIYFDDLLADFFGNSDSFRGLGAYVEFEKNELNPNRVRAKNVYTESTLGTMWGGLPDWLGFTSQEDTYVEFDLTNPELVKAGYTMVFTDQEGNEYPACAYPLYMTYVIQGVTYDLFALVYDEDPIVFEDGIIKFPQNGVEMAAFYEGQYQGYIYLTNSSGYMQFYLPGVEFVNYDMEAVYDGMYVSADGTTAKAIFNFTLGSDIATYKFAFAAGDVTADPSSVAEAIVAGSEDLVIFESDAATKTWQVELTKGDYTLVAVPYSAEGEARLQDTYALHFDFFGVGEAPEAQAFVKATPVARSFAKANVAL